MNKNNVNNENITYEEAMKRLEKIVATLEMGDKSLDESLELYQEGIRLTNICNNMLKEAEQKVLEISKEDK